MKIKKVLNGALTAIKWLVILWVVGAVAAIVTTYGDLYRAGM